jgi:tRNA U34 5-carboxymethylaminomethyl modifying GTPase MnmE/TrmE
MPSDILAFIVGLVVTLLATYFSVRWSSFRQALKEFVDVVHALLNFTDEDSTPEEADELKKQIKEFLAALKNTFLAKLLGL